MENHEFESLYRFLVQNLYQSNMGTLHLETLQLLGETDDFREDWKQFLVKYLSELTLLLKRNSQSGYAQSLSIINENLEGEKISDIIIENNIEFTSRNIEYPQVNLGTLLPNYEDLIQQLNEIQQELYEDNG